MRATSRGLADATITITTIGEPAFDGGKPPVRPYVPPPLSDAAIRAAKNIVNVARDRPSRASSEADDHPARLANNADSTTSWHAAGTDSDPWWQVDLEGFYQISGSKIVFASEANWRYVIQLSSEGVQWTTAVDRSQTVRSDAARSDIYPPGAVARYVRVRGVSQVREVEVYGVLSVR